MNRCGYFGRLFKQALPRVQPVYRTNQIQEPVSVFSVEKRLYCSQGPTRKASTLPSAKIFEPEMDRKENTKEYFASLCQLANLAPKIAFIGGGNMAQALSKGFLKTGLLEKDAISASDPVPAMRDFLEQKLEIKAYSENRDLLDHNKAGIVILAVKPQHLDHVLDEIVDHWTSSPSKFGLLVSIVAGASIQKIHEKFISAVEGLPVPSVPIVRVMPNTPALIGCAASVYAKNPSCTSAHGEVIKALMETVGICHEVVEGHIDAVTGVRSAFISAVEAATKRAKELS